MASKKKVPADGPKFDLGTLLEQLLPFSSIDSAALRWPPDAFALCAYLLKLSGCYVEVVSEWPPLGALRKHPTTEKWAVWAHRIGSNWRSVATTKGPLPIEVTDLWQEVLSIKTKPFQDLQNFRPAVTALLQLVALADEASVGAGLPGGPTDPFSRRAKQLLAAVEPKEVVTLSPSLSPARLRVLPKQHTPRGGLTLRSLTHHLSLHIGCEVTPFWYTVPQTPSDHSLNLLIAPWPLSLCPVQFQPTPGSLNEMPKKFGFVQFNLDSDPEKVAAWTSDLLEAAEKISGPIDGVVFPEGALTVSEYNLVRTTVLAHGAFLIAGVMRNAKGRGNPPFNLVMFDAMVSGLPMHVEQRKHHRWRLDRGQIEMYGLGGTVDPNRDWWEHISVGSREVNFISLNEQLSLCCLVCEDLARQDPVAELVRSVGPNLVVALLMDAPQVGMRWPARYASVLADDPGSSVLTVTSAGMVDLARPHSSVKPSRSVALWKDAHSNFVELELPQGASGLLLNLCTESVEEWTADGRTDQGVTGHPRLGGVHPVKIDANPLAKRRRRK